MASITIRKIDEKLKTKLRVRAAEHGNSMEEEVREILTAVLDGDHKSLPMEKPGGLYTAIRRRLAEAGLNGIEFRESDRGPWRKIPDLGK